MSGGSTTLAEALRNASSRLTDAGVDDPSLDARLLVEHFSHTQRIDAIRDPNKPIDVAVIAAIEAAVGRRAAGEPVHRILGFRDFYGLRLGLSPETLEPRPDTEILVDTVLPFVRDTARKGECRILDLGTGTGAIALALINEVPGATAVGADISEAVLATALENAERGGLARRFRGVCSNWFEEIDGRHHLIVSNPPYIPSKELETLQQEVRKFDPVRALDGGGDGLDAYRAIVADGGSFLEAEGRVALEIGHSQRSEVTKLFLDAGYLLLEARKDLGGNDRVLVFGAGW
jgi:release factor glutamine methyltransferase